MFAARGPLVALLVAAALPIGSAAQESVGPWSLVVRGTLSGSSYESSPDGFKVYSGVAIEGGARREVGGIFALELALRMESREFNGPPDGTDALGGFEVAALTPALLWRPRGRSDAAFQPYVGVGAAISVVWEKDGALDSVDMSPELDPLVQIGLDFDVARRLAVNLDARWHTLGWTIDDYVSPSPTVKVDPLVLGLGARVAL